MNSIMVALVFFILLMSSGQGGDAQQFTVQPESVTQAEELGVVFECLYPGATAYGWALNGSFLSVFPPGVETDSPSVDSPARLIIPATPQYNNTVVQCEAVVREGGVGSFVLSESATLRVQGPLEPVSRIQVGNNRVACFSFNITISWEAPFSLNLTTAEPDIQYCVDVYNVAGGEDDHLQSVCDITDTHYTLTASDPDQLFNFTVTPRNNVEGSLNGTSMYIQSQTNESGPQPIPIGEVDFFADTNLTSLKVVFPSSVIDSCHPPTGYLAHIGNTTNETLCRCTTDNSTEGNMTVLYLDSTSCDELERHCRYNLTIITEFNTGKNRSSDLMDISTHDAYKVDILMEEGNLAITATYLNGSKEEGFFVIIYPSDDSQVLYRVVYRNGTESSTAEMIREANNTMNDLAVYDLEGRMNLEKTPAVVTTDRRKRGFGALSANLDLIVTNQNGRICIHCSPSISDSDCVGVIHSASGVDVELIQLNISTNLVECTNKSDQLEGLFSVAVFQRMDNRLSESPIHQALVQLGALTTTTDDSMSSTAMVGDMSVDGAIAGSAVAVILALCGVVLVLTAVCCWKKNKTKVCPVSQQSNSVPSTHDSRYETVEPALSSCPEEQNPHYENVEPALSSRLEESPPDYNSLVSPNQVQTEPVSLATSHHDHSVSISENEQLPPLSSPCQPENDDIATENSIQFIPIARASSMVCVSIPSKQRITSFTHINDMEPQQLIQPEQAMETGGEPVYANATPVKPTQQQESPRSCLDGQKHDAKLHYATPALKAHSGTPPAPKKPEYASIDMEKLVPVDEDQEKSDLPKQIKVTSPPTRPTPETVLSELHPIAEKWEELGEALGVPEHRLDNISMEGSDQVRLHEMIQCYLQLTHSWEEIVRALEEIGETEAADKIVRTKGLEIESSTNNVKTTPPTLPPRGNVQSTPPEPESESRESTYSSPPSEHLSENHENGLPASISTASIISNNQVLVSLHGEESGCAELSSIEEPQRQNSVDHSDKAEDHCSNDSGIDSQQSSSDQEETVERPSDISFSQPAPESGHGSGKLLSEEVAIQMESQAKETEKKSTADDSERVGLYYGCHHRRTMCDTRHRFVYQYPVREPESHTVVPGSSKNVESPLLSFQIYVPLPLQWNETVHSESSESQLVCVTGVPVKSSEKLQESERMLTLHGHTPELCLIKSDLHSLNGQPTFVEKHTTSLVDRPIHPGFCLKGLDNAKHQSAALPIKHSRKRSAAQSRVIKAICKLIMHSKSTPYLQTLKRSHSKCTYEAPPVLSSSSEVTEGKWRRFRGEDIVTLDFLGLERFKKHYIKDTFSPEDMLLIMKELLAIAPIPLVGESQSIAKHQSAALPIKHSRKRSAAQSRVIKTICKLIMHSKSTPYLQTLKRSHSKCTHDTLPVIDADDDMIPVSEQIERVVREVAQELKIASQQSEPSSDKVQKKGELFDSIWMYISDCGGQPQFHDFSALFMPHFSVARFIFHLIDDFSKFPLDEYYKDGQLMGLPRASHMTLGETLKSLTLSIESHCSQEKKPNQIFVGTFLVSIVALKGKNRAVLSLVPGNVTEQVVYANASMRHPVFAINALSQDKNTLKIDSAIRNAIEKCHKLLRRVIVWWFVLDFYVQNKLACTLERDVLSKEEYLLLATGFGFTLKHLKATLNFFDKVCIARYDLFILPNTVFVDAQIPLDKVTELTEHAIALRDASAKPCSLHASDVTGEKWRRFRDEDVVTLEFLGLERFKKHCIKGIFSPENMLLIMELLVIAPIPVVGESDCLNSKTDFFMPSLLKSYPPAELGNYHKINSFWNIRIYIFFFLTRFRIMALIARGFPFSKSNDMTLSVQILEKNQRLKQFGNSTHLSGMCHFLKSTTNWNAAPPLTSKMLVKLENFALLMFSERAVYLKSASTTLLAILIQPLIILRISITMYHFLCLLKRPALLFFCLSWYMHEFFSPTCFHILYCY